MFNKKTSIYLLFLLGVILIQSCTKEMDYSSPIKYIPSNHVRFSDTLKDENGNSIRDVLVVLWAGNKRYADVSDENGEYLIDVPLNVLPTSGQIALSFYNSNYRPKTITYTAPFIERTRYILNSNSYFSSCPNCLEIINSPITSHELFHLGDDSFTGSANSKFQKSADTDQGLTFLFKPPVNRQFRVYFFAKGVQGKYCQDNVVIYNGTSKKILPSPSNGNYQFYSFTFFAAPNASAIFIRPSTCDSDTDDWEIIGMTIEAL